MEQEQQSLKYCAISLPTAQVHLCPSSNLSWKLTETWRCYHRWQIKWKRVSGTFGKLRKDLSNGLKVELWGREPDVCWIR